MSGERHDLVGIKQIIRLEWLRKTANLLLAGLEPEKIRQGLHDYLQNDQLYSGGKERSGESRSFAVGNLMKIWVSPVADLLAFRDAALDYLRHNPGMDMAIHWAMLCAAYPFWFNIARQTGRLLALQSRVTSAQVGQRLKEQYGDRSTVLRNTGYVLSAFRAWGALRDAGGRGCYENAEGRPIADPHLAILLLEAALLAMPEGKSPLNQLLHCPAFFPFRLPALGGDFMASHSQRLELARYGAGGDILALRG